MKTNTDEMINARDKWIASTDRFEKMEWMIETCSASFIQEHLMSEMVSWFDDRDFNRFFDHISRCWEINTPPETEATDFD